MMNRRNALAVVILLAAGLAACGDTNPIDAAASAQGVTLDLQPLQAQVQPGGTVTFLGAVTGTTDIAVTWEVVEAGGGSIDASGHYSAPQVTGQYHVRAVSHADPTVLGVATVSVVTTPVVSVSVSPASPSVATGGSVTFTASVTGSSDTTATWTVQETSGCGAISSSGVYTAPGTAGTCHVVATSRADATKRATSNVTVTAATPPPPSGPQPACATEPLRTTGTVYYYCDCGTGASSSCVPGNDANAGTSAGAPRRTLGDSRTRFNGMNAGDTVALCRGGAWSEAGGGITNGRCTAGSTCDFRDYTPAGETARPILNITSGESFSLTSGTPRHGLRFWNLDVRKPAGASYHFNLYSVNTDIDLCNVRMYGGSYGLIDQTGTSGRNITLRNSQIYNTTGKAVMGASDNLTVDGNYFENNGQSTSPQNHTIYFQQSTGNAVVTGGRITNNDIRNNANCGGVEMVLHGQWNGLVVENNRIENFGSTNVNCYGIQAAGSAASAHFNNMIVRRNRIYNMPGTAIEISGCSDCTVSDNIVVNGGININTSTGSNTIPGTAATVQNNSIHGGRLWIGAQGSGYIIENNAIWTNGSTCVTNGQGTTRYANNVCRVSGGVAASTWWTDVAARNFTPVSSGPLIGAADQAHYSPIAIGTVDWSPTDPGVARSAPVHAGAY
jgi:hypothetical protein